ncbi:MAG TPA: ABC transporter substrate-binding protein [Thauera sp.]|uniref:ABC transporter substrate-binding protein n=1 Tax=Thauera sp. TaxID=1905334 RepID=UPI002623E194|nr:ABC transporter substrate-binding protein [Thauera sp.]MCP5225383.1 ABC transporter substrate-binding protein [Thauera sp.]HRV77203.1 ABC transporter substrate-binding protein [Thauera sp.]
MNKTRLALALPFALATLAGMAATPASAQTVRWAAAGDALTMDPHAQNEGPTHVMNHQVYDSLVFRDQAMKLAPRLATSWKITDDPNVWEFKLREGVKYHNGNPFTADDVVFSILRAKHENSDMKGLLTSVVEVTKVDEHTVRMRTDGPNPLLPNNLTNLFIMDREWSEANKVTLPQNYKAGDETYAVRNTNGTGPFRLVKREPDVRTELERNEDYWGKGSYPMEVAKVVFTPVRSAATRVAALLSGEIDFLLDPPVQDLERLSAAKGIVVRSGPENRTIFFGMNQGATELRSSDVKGRNPFADKRVREAMNIAINREAVRRVVMRGQSVPAGIVAPPFIDGYDKAMDVVPAPDVARAKALLAEAGYPDGFAVTLSCPNDRYVNDEAICQAATGMFGQIGVKARLDARPKSIHFAELPKGELDLYMLGWGVPTMDSHYVFHYLYETRTDKGGSWNVTGYSSPRVDELTKAMNREIDLGKRAGMVAETWKTVQDDIVYLPIHHQMLNWAMKDDIDFPVQSENYPYFKLLKYRK